MFTLKIAKCLTLNNTMHSIFQFFSPSASFDPLISQPTRDLKATTCKIVL